MRVPAWAGNRKHRSIAPRLFHHCCAEQDRKNLTITGLEIVYILGKYAFFRMINVKILTIS